MTNIKLNHNQFGLYVAARFSSWNSALSNWFSHSNAEDKDEKKNNLFIFSDSFESLIVVWLTESSDSTL